MFKNSPVRASLSGLAPRMIGVGFKRVPKFGFLLGISCAPPPALHAMPTRTTEAQITRPQSRGPLTLQLQPRRDCAMDAAVPMLRVPMLPACVQRAGTS